LAPRQPLAILAGYRSAAPSRLPVEVIPTKRRKQDDVFLIGEESLFAEQASEPDPDPATAAIGPGAVEFDAPLRGPSPPRPLGALPGPRGLALLGLGAAAAATLGALELTGGGDRAPVQDETSARSPQIARSAASAPAQAEVPSHLVTPDQPKPERPPTPWRTVTTHPGEPEREPTPPVAPVSSPVPVTLHSPPASAPAVEPAPPSPPPSSSGGGSGGVERFGFER
jgi:hypothetical protein